MGRTVITALFCGFCLLNAGCTAAERISPDSAGTVKPEERAFSADQSPSRDVQERALSARPDLIVASLEKDLPLLAQETRLAQARLAQPGTDAQEVASAAFPQLDVLTRSISTKATALQQIFARPQDPRLEGAATSLKASADQMIQMVAAIATRSQSVSIYDIITSALQTLSQLTQSAIQELQTIRSGLIQAGQPRPITPPPRP